mmetsp:Transcript_22907/g.58563  ORF Transcript_22907/g.58563 Transcript_22907/m.58563 type:complete len:216 (-) Transcript_22907:114-761(-)
MVLPQAVLKAASGGPTLVELKNGDSYSGTLAAVDNMMNIRLEEVVFTPRSEYRFEKLKECTIRGQFVKFIRFPDDLLGRVVAEEAATSRRGGGRGGGRGGRGAQGSGPSIRLAVPSNLVGAVIGKGGETIKRLSLETGARIEVAKDAPPTAPERNIFLSGPADAVEKAKGLIESMVRDRSSGYKSSGGGGAAGSGGPGGRRGSGGGGGGRGRGPR